MRILAKVRLFGIPVAIALVGAAFGTAVGTTAEKPAPTPDWFASLRPGMWVKAEGTIDPNGGLRAQKFKIVHGDLDEVEVTSAVTRVDAESRTIETALGVRVVTDVRSQLRNQESTVGFGAVRVGDRIEAEGQLQRDGTLLASEIEIRAADVEHDIDEDEISGKIESVDLSARKIVLLGTTVHIDDKTKNKTRKVQ